MARSPYKLFRPFVVSFSGGRSSAYMLWHILDAYGGMPDDGLWPFPRGNCHKAKTKGAR